MRSLVLAAIPMLAFVSPAFSADLDGPVYPDRYTIERPLPPKIVERERIIEHHHYYEPAPQRRVYIEQEPRVYAYVPRIYAYRPIHRRAYHGGRDHHFYPRHAWRHRQHERW